MEAKIVTYHESHQNDLEDFYRDVYSEMGFPLNLDSKHSDLRRIEEAYATPSGGFWILQDGERIIGTVALRALSDETGELKRLFLRSQVIGRGHGLALARHALAEAERLGYRRVRLDTTSKAQRALSLFRRLGFTEIDRYNDNPDAEFWMEIDLSRHGPASGLKSGPPLFYALKATKP